MKIYCDGVFMGGGVRGIGYAGAIGAFQAAGYEFKNVAGTSVGAIVASLVAAGYTGDELEKEMKELDYHRFKGKGHFGLVSNLFDFRKDYGIYNSDYFEKWLADLLSRKNIVKFKDLEYLDWEEKGKIKNRLTITATDITKRKLLVLPQDLADYGIDPREFEVAKAVRMSMSIPIFYHPYRLTDVNGVEHWIVDGGTLCNYPMFLFDDGKHKLKRPIFGFKFDSGMDASHILEDAKSSKAKEKLPDYVLRIADLVLDSQNLQYSRLVPGDAERTIDISVVVKDKVVSPINFGLSGETSLQLSKNGHIAATKFLESWDFKKWLKRFR
jgi:NTE family protein